MRSSGLGHAGAAAAAAAHEGGNLFDDLPGVVTFRKVGGYRAKHHGLAVAFTAISDSSLGNTHIIIGDLRLGDN